MDKYAERALLEYNSEEFTPYPGGVDGRAFWNTNSSQFIYAPTLQFPKLPRARAYRYTAKDKNGKYRPVGVTRVCGKRPALKVNISDAMLKKADTNYFLLRMPWWYKAFGPEDKVVVSCHRVEREIPLQKSLYIRLRSE